MNRAYVVGVVAALLTSTFIVVLLRRGYLREKFAAFWLLVASALLILSLFPGILRWAAQVAGVEVPANLLFLLAAVLLLLVGVQLSYEVGRLDLRSQRLAEEVALLRAEVDEIQGRTDRDRQVRGQCAPRPVATALMVLTMMTRSSVSDQFST